MSRSSSSSGVESSRGFSVSRGISNGNHGVVSSVIWLMIGTGLCCPWLVEKSPASKAGEPAKSVAWFVILGLNLIIGTMSSFSLWFRKSTLSIMILIWGACAIVATFLLGSFAMIPAVATMCCCAPDLCAMGAADTSSLDDNFCFVPANFCMETRWTMWSFYGGILLTMVSIVLLINSVGLHHKALLAYEHARNEAAKAARAAFRARRRRQELWEEEVYGYPSSSSRTILNGPNLAGLVDESTPTKIPTHADRSPLDRAPAFQSPSLSPPHLPAPPPPITAVEPGEVTPPVSLDPLAPFETEDKDCETQQCYGSPTSAPESRSEWGVDDGVFSIGAYTGTQDRRCKDLGEDGRNIVSWGGKPSTSRDVLVSWVADDKHDGRITPKTALRFKTSALARAMHN